MRPYRRTTTARHLRAWSLEQEAVMVAGLRAGKTPAAIADELGLRGEDAIDRVKHKLVQLRIRHADVDEPDRGPKYRPAMRKCLGCGQRFRSEWIGNRICRSCSDRSDPLPTVSVGWTRGGVR